MKYDGDENYFFKRTIQAYEQKWQFGRWIWEVRYWEHIEIIATQETEINKSEGVKLRNAGII
jgi:hypothetical protein